MMSKSNVVKFRWEERPLNLLKSLCGKDMNTSDAIRKILEYFLMDFMLGRINKPISELRDEFVDTFNLAEEGQKRSPQRLIKKGKKKNV